MGIFNRLSARFSARSKSAAPTWSLFRPLSSWKSGQSPRLAIPAVGSCIDRLAGDCGRIPVEVERRSPIGPIPVDSICSQLLTDGPTDLVSGSAYRNKIVRDLLISGSHLSLITRDGRGDVLEVTPAEVGTWGYNWDQQRQALTYQAFGRTVLPNDVLHFRRAEREWFHGRGVLEQYASTLDQISASYQAAHRVFKSSLPKLTLSTPEPLSPEATSRLQQATTANHSDASSWSTPIVVSGGMQVGEISTRLDQSQWAQGVEFSVADVARMFNVPSSLLDSSSSPSDSDMSAYIEHGLRPLLDVIEAEFKLKMLVPGERLRFRTAHLSRGTASSQAAAARQLIDAGIQTPNEARISLGMPALDRPEMDEVQISKNYTPLTQNGPSADDVGSDAAGDAE